MSILTVKNRNENQSRHIANSLRIIGMTQFAAFGYPSLIKKTFMKCYFSYKVLKTEKE